MPDNLSVREANGTLTSVRTTERSGVHTPLQNVQTTIKRFRDGFEDGTIDPAKWDVSLGAGGNITETGGNLIMTSGTTASSVSSITSKTIFAAPVKMSVGLQLSQRIANQSFWVELVSCDPVTGVVNEQNIAAWFFDGTTATTGRYRVKAQNGSVLDSSGVTIVSTASVAVFDIEPGTMDTWFHSETLDSNSTRSNSYRRHQKAMDPDCVFKIRFRWENAATAPASSTTATIAFISCMDHTELTAEISSVSLGAGAGQAMPVVGAGGSFGVTNSDNIWWQESVTAQAANATVTGASRDSGASTGVNTRYGFFRALVVTDQAGTLRIEVSNDGTTWRRATVDTAVAANTPTYLAVPLVGRFHRAILVNGATAQGFLLFNTSYTAG